MIIQIENTHEYLKELVAVVGFTPEPLGR